MTTNLHAELAALMAEHARLVQADIPEDMPRHGKQKAAPKKWEVCIRDEKGVIQAIIVSGKIKELSQTFDRAQEADQWACNKLAKGASGWYAEISLSGTTVSTRIHRDVAIQRIFGNNRPGPVFHQKSGRGGTMEFGVKAHQTRVEFSRG